MSTSERLPSSTATASDVPSISKAFISSLDRSMLGSFGADPGALFLCDVKERHRVLTHRPVSDGWLPLPDDDAVSRWAIESLAEHFFESEQLYNLFSELFYWWSVSGDAELVAASEAGNGMQVTGGVAKFADIASHPEMHGFFEVGIWDVEVIARFLSGGIDPDMALSMLGRSARVWSRAWT